MFFGKRSFKLNKTFVNEEIFLAVMDINQIGLSQILGMLRGMHEILKRVTVIMFYCN